MVPVYVIEHFLSCVQQGVQGADALVSDDDSALPVDVGMYAQCGLQACHVDASIGYVAGARIARQVVEFIYVECAAQEAIEELVIWGQWPCAGWIDEIRYALG